MCDIIVCYYCKVIPLGNHSHQHAYLHYDNQYLFNTGTMLKKNKVLKSLELLNCELGREGLSKLCRAIRGNTALTSLNLSQNKFDDQSTTSLGK